MIKLILVGVVCIWGYGFLQHPPSQSELLDVGKKAEADFKVGLNKINAEIKKQ
jgi:hypothetical protein